MDNAHSLYIRLLALLILTTLALPQIAAAHGIRLFVRADQTTLAGRVSTQHDAPVQQATITVTDTAGVTLATATTDEEGRFSLPRPASGALIISATTPDGHAAPPWTVPAVAPVGRDARPPLPPDHRTTTGTSATRGEDLRAALGPLQEEIARLRTEIRFRDILGGIGFLIGFFGLWFILATRRRQALPSEGSPPA